MRVSCLLLTLAGLSLTAVTGKAETAAQLIAPVVAGAGNRLETAQGIRWEKSLATAKKRAAKTGKPLFLLHLFGRLDEAFC